MNVSQVRKEFGKCLELVSMDPNFHEISVGLLDFMATFIALSI